jgi:hypothetical protein
VFTNDGLLIANNLMSGVKMSHESESEVTFLNNLIKDFTHAFADPGRGDLHLTSAGVEAIDQGVLQAEVAEDIDAQRRGDKPDIGADELTN